MAPVYVTFAVPQRVLVDLREAMARRRLPGDRDGKVAMVENTVDATTGLVTVRGVMNNADETLWPGTLVNTKLIVRIEDAVVVPSAAVQRSQNGNYRIDRRLKRRLDPQLDEAESVERSHVVAAAAE